MSVFLLALLKNWMTMGDNVRLDSTICSEQCSEVTGFYRQKSRDIQKKKNRYLVKHLVSKRIIYWSKTNVKAFQGNIYIFEKLVTVGDFIQ